jgi:hypothetical protein
MTRHGVRVLTIVVGAVLCFAGLAQGQYQPHMVKVRVPFEFTFHGKVFAAGDYVVVCTPITVELRTPQGETVAKEIPHSVESRVPVPAKLVFNSDDGVHALSQIWPGGTSSGYEFAPPKPATLLANQCSHKPGESAGGGNK